MGEGGERRGGEVEEPRAVRLDDGEAHLGHRRARALVAHAWVGVACAGGIDPEDGPW